MNGKPDEHLDQWVRQSLDRLRDTPPPGSTFDAERLWGQLQPELQNSPARRRIGSVWWAAAACLLGFVLLGWLWLTQQPVTTVVDYQPASTGPVQLEKPAIRARESPVAQRGGRSKFAAKRLHLAEPMVVSKPQTPVQPLEPVETKNQPPVSLAEPTPGVETPVEPPKTITAAATPKRQFQMVHINELVAEEEARPKLYRTEHFVRLGTCSRQESAQNQPSPLIIIPLTKKTNQ